MRLLVGALVLMRAVGFTQKESAHCLRWSYDELPSLIPTEATGSNHGSDRTSGSILCRPMAVSKVHVLLSCAAMLLSYAAEL